MGRDISRCHPKLQKLAATLKSTCQQKGLIIEIGECLRTAAEQDNLYTQGRTQSGSIITNAKGNSFSSMHQWGVAFDIYRNDGQGSYNESGGFFNQVGAVGKSIGLEWGGDWKSIVDKPHFQLPDWGSTPASLKQKYGTPDAFISTWKSTGSSQPVINQNPTPSASTNSWVLRLQRELNIQGFRDKNGNRLSEDGVPGTLTLSATPTLKTGAKGNITKLVQERLGFSGSDLDGNYGPKTVAQVKLFQRNIVQMNNPDGIITKGNMTWKKLIYQ